MWLNPPETSDLVTFTEEILNQKLHFMCSDRVYRSQLTINEVFVKSITHKRFVLYSEHPVLKKTLGNCQKTL